VSAATQIYYAKFDEIDDLQKVGLSLKEDPFKIEFLLKSVLTYFWTICRIIRYEFNEI
jgi:hypothetical protein